LNLVCSIFIISLLGEIFTLILLFYQQSLVVVLVPILTQLLIIRLSKKLRRTSLQCCFIFWSFGIIDVSTIKCWELSTAQAGARGREGCCIFSLCNFVSRDNFVSRLLDNYVSLVINWINNEKSKILSNLCMLFMS
jgi:hypothetical protein